MIVYMAVHVYTFVHKQHLISLPQIPLTRIIVSRERTPEFRRGTFSFPLTDALSQRVFLSPWCIPLFFLLIPSRFRDKYINQMTPYRLLLQMRPRIFSTRKQASLSYFQYFYSFLFFFHIFLACCAEILEERNSKKIAPANCAKIEIVADNTKQFKYFNIYFTWYFMYTTIFIRILHFMYIVIRGFIMLEVKALLQKNACEINCEIEKSV